MVDTDLQVLLSNMNDDERRYLSSLIVTHGGFNVGINENTTNPELLSAEIIKYGSNSILALVGVENSYKDIVYDVGRRLKSGVNRSDPISTMDEKILINVFKSVYDKMDSHEKDEFQRAVKSEIENFDVNILNFTGQAFTAMFQLILKQNNGKILLIIANFVSRVLFNRGLTMVGAVGLGRVAGLIAGPIGWTFTALWTIYDIAAPAYRVTIRVVIYLAIMNIQYRNSQKSIQ